MGGGGPLKRFSHVESPGLDVSFEAHHLAAVLLSAQLFQQTTGRANRLQATQSRIDDTGRTFPPSPIYCPALCTSESSLLCPVAPPFPQRFVDLEIPRC